MILISSFGKAEVPYRDELIKRTKILIPLRWDEIPIKKCPSERPTSLLPEEKKFLEKHPKKNLILLDIEGEQISSKKFYELCFESAETQDLHFVIGPAPGLHPKFNAQAKKMISLSRLTLTHQMAQMLLMETVYRAACRLKNHPFDK